MNKINITYPSGMFKQYGYLSPAKLAYILSYLDVVYAEKRKRLASVNK